MNTLELRMVDILKELKDKHGAVSVRAEFEAEGTKLEELLRLKEISMVAGLGLNLKIGGCESVRDMLEARLVGVDTIVAPMIESAYATRKYLQAISKVFSAEELQSINIFCNIETLEAVNRIEEIMSIPEIDTLDGITIGRIDLCFSQGMDERSMNADKINSLVMATIKKAKNKDMICGIGGGVSAHSLPFFKSFQKNQLDLYQTRKVCFGCPLALESNPEKGIIRALAFEFLWLENKLNYFKGISEADRQRMSLLEEQYIKSVDLLLLDRQER